MSTSSPNPSCFRNYATFDAGLLPVQVIRAFQPCNWNGFDVFVMLTKPCTGNLTLQSSMLPRLPLITIWDLMDEEENPYGFLFQPAGQMVRSSSSHIQVQSPSLTRQFSVDDAVAEGKVTRVASVPEFNMYVYDIGATLLAQRALGFLNKVLDKEAK